MEGLKKSCGPVRNVLSPPPPRSAITRFFADYSEQN